VRRSSRHRDRPPVSWVRTLESTAAAHGKEVVVGLNGSIYVAGWFRGIVDVGNGQVGLASGWEQQSDGVVLAYGLDGSRQWGRTLSGISIEQLAATSDGGVVIAGGAQGGAMLDGQALGNIITRAFVARLGPTGNRQWGRIIGSTTDEPTYAIALAIAPPDQILVTHEERLGHLMSGVLSALDAGGGDLWTASATALPFAQLAVGPDGIVSGGQASGFGTSDVFPNLTSGATFLAAYDLLGNPLDGVSFGPPPSGIGVAGARGLALSGQELAFTAMLREPVDFGTGPISSSNVSTAIVMLGAP
jgi:hypothetical protein